MNCDRVFDILTRGPFPSGAPSDERVERHLSNCPACRRLASALQPAIELFEEAITPEEGRDLPAYWGELFVAEQDDALGRGGSTWRGGTTTRIATRLRHATGIDLETVRRTLPNAWRLAAAVLLGVCVGGLLRSADLADRGSRGPQAAVADAPPQNSDGPTLSVASSGGPQILSLFSTFSRETCAYVPEQPNEEDDVIRLNQIAHDAADSPEHREAVRCFTCHHETPDRQEYAPRERVFMSLTVCQNCHADGQ